LLEQGIDGCCIEASGGEDADGAVSGRKSFFRYDAVKGGLEAAQEAYLDAAKTGGVGRCMEAPGGFEGIADSADSGCPRGSQYWAQDGGKHVDVLVGVDVSEVDSAAL